MATCDLPDLAAIYVIGFHLHITWLARTTRLLWLITMASMDVYVRIVPPTILLST
jgi:hypothetical protein